MKHVSIVLRWISSILLLFTGVSLLIDKDLASIGMLGMGISLFPPLHNLLKSKTNFKKPWIIWLGLFFVSFVTFGILNESTTEPTDNFDQVIESYLEELEETDDEFKSSLESTEPEDVLNAKYEDLVEEYGEQGGEFIDGFAIYVGTYLNLDVNKMYYVQKITGTMGIQRLLKAMNEDNSSVQEVLSVVQRYHELRSYNTDIFDQITSSASTKEAGNLILAEFANIYRTIYGYEPELNSYKENKIEEVLAISNLYRADLEIVMAHHIGVSNIIALFPDDYPNKAELIEILSW